MTGTPPSAPNEPFGDSSGEEEGQQYTSHASGRQHPETGQFTGAPDPTGGHGRHEMPGLSGYPQFGGLGAAQYGSEPVEPPPPLPAQPGAPVQVPGYAQAGAVPPGYPTQQGMPPQGPPPGGYQGAGGFPPPGNTPPGGYPVAGGTRPGGFAPPGTMPPANTAPGPTGGLPAYDYPREKLNVGAALAYGWDKFRLNPIPWVGMVLIGLVAWLVVTLLVNIVDVQSLSAVLLLFAVASLLVWLLQAAMIRGALYETDGTPPDFPAFFGFVNAGNVLLTALIVFVVCLVASFACLFPAIIVGVLCMFALNFVIDQDQNPLEAIKSSVLLVIHNALQVSLLALAVFVMTFFGVLLCGLGLLVAGPVTAIAITYAYRTLTGRLVVPV